jgi:hypothetical protein
MFVRRFSLRLLFLLTLVSAATVAYWTRPSPQERIQRVLVSSMSDVEKRHYLSRYFNLGDHESAVHEQIGLPWCYVGGSVQYDCCYDECGLVLSFRSDGTLFRIEYNIYPHGSSSPDCHLLDAWPLDPAESK